jgi:DNA processing protein
MNNILLHLVLISDVGPAAVTKLQQVLPFDQFDQLYHWGVQDFMYKAGLSEKVATLLVQGLFDTKLLDQELALIKKHAIRWVTIAQDEYPLFLRNTHLPPLVLYWRGADLTVLESSIAVVGSRKANAYGQQFIDEAVPELVAAGWCVVSGGALGADTLAHKAALSCQGITCAVIGSGLLVPYPQSNKRLFEAIVERGGIVMSPFPLTMEALPGNFPARNRIISGLSQTTVVVQAAIKSGALITAFYALEQGREVCAVPGPLHDPLSAGCHAIIREGALLVTSGHDILLACGDVWAHSFDCNGEHVSQKVPAQKVSRAVPENSIVLAKEPPVLQPAYPYTDAVMQACAAPQMFDDLCILLGYDETQLQERLLTLQLEGFLDQDIMGRWYSIV